MAYMSKEMAKDIRDRLKAEFPSSEGWKLSVRKGSGALSIDVDFLAGPHEFETLEGAKPTRTTVNHYHVDSQWKPESAAILKRALRIILRDHWDESDCMVDYFNCAYYVHVGIGQWDRPYVHKVKARA